MASPGTRNQRMTTAPTAAPPRRVCMLVYWDSPTALPPMFNHGVSLAAAGFDVEFICLAPHSAPAGPEVLVPGLRITPSPHSLAPLVSRALRKGHRPPRPGGRAVRGVVHRVPDEGGRCRAPLPRGRVRGQRPAAPAGRRGCPRSCAASRLCIALTNCGPRRPPTCVSPPSGGSWNAPSCRDATTS